MYWFTGITFIHSNRHNRSTNSTNPVRIMAITGFDCRSESQKESSSVIDLCLPLDLYLEVLFVVQALNPHCDRSFPSECFLFLDLEFTTGGLAGAVL